MLKTVRTMLIIILNIIFYGVVVFALYQICHSGYMFAYDVLGETMAELPPGQNKEFVVSPKDSDFQVAENLEEQGLIKGRYTFYIRAKLEERENITIQPGTFTLNSSMTYEEIISELSRGNTTSS